MVGSVFVGLARYICRREIMKVFLGCIMIVACVMIVGYIEDPCTTEGLMQGCMN